MQGIKRVLVGLSIFVYVPLCGMLAMSFALNRTVTKPDYIKTTMRSSGIYDAIAKQLQTNLIMANEQGEEVPAQVKTALAESLTASSLQGTIESVTDTAYTVLDNPELVLDKKIDLKPLKDGFSASLQNQLEARAKKLPACTATNPPKTEDIFTINCIPLGTDVDEAIDTAVSQTLDSEGVPADSVSLSALLADNPSSKNLILQLSTGFDWAKISVYIMIVLLGLATTVIITLSATKRGGLHRVTTLLLTAAILLAGLSWLMLFVLGRVNFISEQGVSIESSLGSAFRLLSLDIFRVVLWFSVVYGVLGVLLLLFLYSTEKKKRKPV